MNKKSKDHSAERQPTPQKPLMIAQAKTTIRIFMPRTPNFPSLKPLHKQFTC